MIPLLKKKKTHWLIMLHLADGLVNVAFQLQRVFEERIKHGIVVHEEWGVMMRPQGNKLIIRKRPLLFV